MRGAGAAARSLTKALWFQDASRSRLTCAERCSSITPVLKP